MYSSPVSAFCWASPHAPSIVGLIVERSLKKGLLPISAAVLAGLLATYVIGTVYLYFMVNYTAAPGNEIDFAKAVSLGVTPLLPLTL